MRAGGAIATATCAVAQIFSYSAARFSAFSFLESFEPFWDPLGIEDDRGGDHRTGERPPSRLVAARDRKHAALHRGAFARKCRADVVVAERQACGGLRLMRGDPARIAEEIQSNPETCALRGLPSRSGVRQRQQQADQLGLPRVSVLRDQAMIWKCAVASLMPNTASSLLRRIAVHQPFGHRDLGSSQPVQVSQHPCRARQPPIGSVSSTKAARSVRTTAVMRAKPWPTPSSACRRPRRARRAAACVAEVLRQLAGRTGDQALQDGGVTRLRTSAATRAVQKGCGRHRARGSVATKGGGNPPAAATGSGRSFSASRSLNR